MIKVFEVYYRAPEGHYKLVDTLGVYPQDDKPVSYTEYLESVFRRMQGENWSPNGEAREKIISLGLTHTSMMVGDFIRDTETGKLWKVEVIGWKEVDSPCQ